MSEKPIFVYFDFLGHRVSEVIRSNPIRTSTDGRPPAQNRLRRANYGSTDLGVSAQVPIPVPWTYTDSHYCPRPLEYTCTFIVRPVVPSSTPVLIPVQKSSQRELAGSWFLNGSRDTAEAP